MVIPADNGNARPAWFVTGGTNWWEYINFWQHFYPPHQHNHRANISEMRSGDRIAMKTDRFEYRAEDEQGNPVISMGIWAIGTITGTRDHFVDVDWRMGDGVPLANYRADAISDRFPQGECIWKMEPDDAATRAFIAAVFGPGALNGNPTGQSSSSFAVAELATYLYLPADFLEEINALLEDKKQVIFQGPPGTGKTYVAQELAQHIAGLENRVTLVQFHPSYAYEDFVQGYRPTLDNGNAGFKLQDGPLLRAAKRAEAESDAKHFLIIDEINRGNLAKVFGELYFLLEYRDEDIRLQYSDEEFRLPPNLYIIGTMNTADRSIALVDLALRRRFYFVEFHPDKDDNPIKGLLRQYLSDQAPGMEWIADVVDRANANELLQDNPHAAIGPSYFMKPGLDEAAVRRIWKYGVLPYIEERLFGQGDARLAEFDLDQLRGNIPSPQPSPTEAEGALDDASDA